MVNCESIFTRAKYLEVSKARDTLTRDNVTLKSKGLSTFKITNVYGSVPLNTVGDELTAYPNVYLNSLFNDGTIGLNNTELSTYFRQTVNRRSKKFNLDEGVKTIYIQLRGDYPTQESEYPTKIWFIKTRTGTVPSSVDYADVIGFSLVNRPEVAPSEDQFFVELTVIGKKSLLDTYLLEYDDLGAAKSRYIYTSQAAALASSEDYYGWIVDYNQSITPVIGISKPKDFSFNNRASGFNEDTDIVLSKGKTGTGSTPYTASFNFSYFNPVFFTKITTESPVDTGFASGKYIIGKTSKAYGVIESDTTSNYSFGNTLFVSTLSGNFLPGETIFDEEGNAIKIAQENTISHFVVNFGGQSYPDNSKLIINGTTIDSANIRVDNYGGKVYRAVILNRNVLTETYSAPPVVTVTPSPTDPNNVATVTPVLFKNTVLTYSPQNIKSFGSDYNGYKFTADVDLTNTSESFGLPATADFMFALISTEELEDLGQLMVKQLKNRYNDLGTHRTFCIGVDRSKMRLYDVEASGNKDTPIMDQGKFGESINRNNKKDFSTLRF